MFLRCLGLICLLLSTQACTSFPPDTPPPGYGQGSPEQTIRYLQWAYENQSPLHVSKCLSTDFMEAENIDPGKIAFAWDEARKSIEETIGDVDEIEVEDTIYTAKDGRAVVQKIVTGNQEAEVTFVVESRYKIIPNDAFADSSEGTFESMDKIASYDKSDLQIRLPKVSNAEELGPKEIHRVVIENAWRIDSVLAKGFARRMGNQKTVTKKVVAP